MKLQPTGRWRRPGSGKQKPLLPPAGSPAPPAAHQARLWPAPRMRSVPPLKGQRVPAGSSSCCRYPTIHELQVIAGMPWTFSPFSPLFWVAEKWVQSCGVSLLPATQSSNSGGFLVRKELWRSVGNFLKDRHIEEGQPSAIESRMLTWKPRVPDGVHAHFPLGGFVNLFPL